MQKLFENWRRYINETEGCDMGDKWDPVKKICVPDTGAPDGVDDPGCPPGERWDPDAGAGQEGACVLDEGKKEYLDEK